MIPPNSPHGGAEGTVADVEVTGDAMEAQALIEQQPGLIHSDELPRTAGRVWGQELMAVGAAVRHKRPSTPL